MTGKEPLPDFQEFLRSRKLAPERQIHFMAVWVSKFIAFSNNRAAQDIDAPVTEFLNSLQYHEKKEKPIISFTYRL